VIWVLAFAALAAGISVLWWRLALRAQKRAYLRGVGYGIDVTVAAVQRSFGTGAAMDVCRAGAALMESEKGKPN